MYLIFRFNNITNMKQIFFGNIELGSFFTFSQPQCNKTVEYSAIFLQSQAKE